jgi:stearoyl-CoA desaturase (Delta-9 desaturase)
LVGGSPFASSKTGYSRNIPFLAVPTFGASLHNNHHAFPDSALLNFKWWHLDLSGAIILAFEKLGLIWGVKIPSDKQIKSKAI